MASTMTKPTETRTAAVRTVISLTEDQHEWLRSVSDHINRSAADIVRVLIERAQAEVGDFTDTPTVDVLHALTERKHHDDLRPHKPR